MAADALPPMPEWETLPRMLLDRAEQAPSAVAVVDGDVRLTTAELLASAEAFAAGLIGLGVSRGDRVAVWAPNTWRWVVAALGIWHTGAVIVPVSTRAKAIEAGQLLDRTGARLLVAADGFLGVDYVDLLAAEYGPAAPDRPFERLPSLRDVLLLSSAGLAGVAEVSVPVEEVRRRALEVRPEDPIEILATSGTTGEPKGVVLAGPQIMRAYWDWSELVGLREGDRYPVVSPFAHGFGINAGLLACIIRGAQIHPIALFDPDTALELVERERLTLLAGPPALFDRLLSRPDLPDRDITSLRSAVVGAAAVPTELIHRMRSVLGIERIVNAYGLIEGSVVSMTRPDDPDEVVASTAGRAVPGQEIAVVDDTGAAVPAGTPGEVLVRGYGVMQGYWKAPDLTRAAVDAEGWLHTGDIGVLDERGNVRIVDRKKEMFIVGGFNAYPAEIENLLGRHPGIAAAAVVGVPDPSSGEAGCAFVVPLPGAALTPAELIAWSREKMSNYKVPRHVHVVESLPLTANGKVDKSALRRLATP
ncbi:AMP-binding protein [Dactylosporangium sucinum]|uniref:3-[(3aS,4S,7aS)-7a-methyl-1, 5-dioxo-octahydro-1H-inden-4-yl]propanoyl:CoA ligase n=1 Tax=Dactylosporangium sucinum TaxID=1424081 RepID=A0A917UBV1_9ACTN|nr:AMP-binding protein [Dactylosporangium sucinum]GGM78101.1 3-[(3aS,4S,7aS)-7a-methyl-1,5-dioxo-octahydro-1H-inden-4-yl]propanoyl:CoA ligase [Dactylosporangium sucinum]